MRGSILDIRIWRLQTSVYRHQDLQVGSNKKNVSNFQPPEVRVRISNTVSAGQCHLIHLQEVLLAQFSQYVHRGGLKPHSFHFLKSRHLYSVLMLSLTLEALKYFLYKSWRSKGFIKYLWYYDIYLNIFYSLSAGSDFRRQNLTLGSTLYVRVEFDV